MVYVPAYLLQNILYFTYNTVNHLHCKFNNSLIWNIFRIDTLFERLDGQQKAENIWSQEKNLKICIIFPGEGLGPPPQPISCLETIAYPYLIFCRHPRVLVTCLCIPCTNWLLEVKNSLFPRVAEVKALLAYDKALFAADKPLPAPQSATYT